MRLGMWVLALALCAPAGAVPVPAGGADKMANTCTADADCPTGQKCEVAPCAQPTCEPGKTCPPVDCAANGYCVAPWKPTLGGPDCHVDADCPYAFVCQDVEEPCGNTSTCACPPCEAGKPCPACDCPPPDATPCTPTTKKQCVFTPKDCTANTDCEAGFECHENKMCSGGGSTGCVCAGCACPTCPPGETCPPCNCPPPEACTCDSASDPAPPPEETCTVESAWCLPKEVECTADADCTTGWKCLEIAVGASCSGGTATDSGNASGGSSGSGGSGSGSSGSGGGSDTPCTCPACPSGETCPPCDCGGTPAPPSCTTETKKYCLPPGWDEVKAELSATGGDSGGVAIGLPKEAADHGAAGPSGSNQNGNSEGTGGTKPPATPSPSGSTASTTKAASSCAASTSGAEPLAIGLVLAFAFLAIALQRRSSRRS